MSNRFSDWFNKIVGKAPSENKVIINSKSIEPILPHETQTNTGNSNYDAYAEYATLKKKLHVEKAFKQIEAYDSAKHKENPNYKSFAYNVEHELDEADVDKKLDEVLDVEQAKKLNVCEEQQITEQRRKELEQQEAIFKERQNHRADVTASIRSKMAEYDAKQTRDGYKTYEEICCENDENSDRDEDEEMERVLQERLGVYDGTTETEEIKQKRSKKQTTLDTKLKDNEKSHQESIAAINRQMDLYHEQNKERANYRAYDSPDPIEHIRMAPYDKILQDELDQIQRSKLEQFQRSKLNPDYEPPRSFPQFVASQRDNGDPAGTADRHFFMNA